MRLLTDDVRSQLGAHTRFASRWKSLSGFWVSFRLEPDDQLDEYWVMLPGERIENPSSFDWLMWGVGALVAAMEHQHAQSVVREGGEFQGSASMVISCTQYIAL